MPRNLAQLVLVIAALSLAGCFGAKRDVAPYLDRAAADRASGDTAKAVAELHEAVHIDPRNPAANLMLAQIEEASGDLKSAISHYVLAAMPDARLIDPQLRVAEFLMEAKRYDEALARINATVGVFPKNAPALAMRADIELQSGQAKAARSDADAALLIDPWSARALAVLAQLDLHDNNIASATSTVSKGLSRHPKDVRLLQVQASLFLTESQPDKAADALETILRESPRSTGALVALAQLEAENGHFDEALDRLRSAASADPANTDLQVALIAFLAARGQPEDVENRLKALISEHPDDNIYDLLLAQYDRQRGENDAAAAVLQAGQKRLEGKPAARELQVAMAKLDMTMSQTVAAQRQLQAVLTADPTNVDALLTRAILARSNGRSEAAIADLLAVVRTDPVNEQAFQLLAAQYLLSEQPTLAVDAMQRAVAITPEDQEANARLAIFLQSAGQIERANEIMSGLLLANPQSQQIAIDAARLALMRRDFATADRAAAHLRAIPGADPAATFVDAEIAVAKGNPLVAASKFRTLIDAKTSVSSEIVQSYADSSIAAGQAAPAAQYLAGILASLPPTVQSTAQRAMLQLWIAAGEPDNAAKAFRAATATAPDNVDCYQIYAMYLAGLKKTDEAEQIIDAGLKTKASRLTLLLLRGVVNTLAERSATALADFKSALDLNPASLEALNDYASTLADVSPTDKAALEQARSSFSGLEQSGSPTTVDTIAWLDYRLGRLDEAKSLLIRIKADKTENPQIRFHLAAVLLATGDRDQGLALLNSVKGLTFPGSDEVRALSAT